MKKDSKDLAGQLLLYGITDRAWLKAGQSLAQQVELAIQGGATMIQLREKYLAEADFIIQAKEVQRVTNHYGVPLIINDNIAVALAVGAEGLHVGQQDLEANIVRSQLTSEQIIGVSAQTVEQAQAAQAAGADYLGVGAVFPTTSKPDAVEVSRDTLQQICAAVEIPVVAIGGITEFNLVQLEHTGVAGIAVISAIFAQDDVKAAAATLKQNCKRLFYQGKSK